MAQKDDIIVMRGGLDLASIPLEVKKGFCIGAQNYESEVRGYRRVEGYERFDGQPKPSLASYWTLDFDSGSVEIEAGHIVTGDTSAATGIALYDATLATGTYGGGDATGELILYGVIGTFVDDEGLEVAAANVATADGMAVNLGESVEATSTTYTQAAIEATRATIAAVTGSGSILGVVGYSGSTYAFRNNAGATAGDMYKSSTAGWVKQTFGHTLDFTGGAVGTLVEGETITGGSSSATATVERVILQSGAWAGSAAGYVVLSGITGTFTAAETATGGTSTGTIVVTAAQVAITLPVGGKYRFKEDNFYGASNLKRLYMVNGEGPAMEWDGTILAPIKTGLSVALEKPTHIGTHSLHLLLGFAGGHLQISGTGLPLSFTSTTGAVALSLGEDITGIKSSTKTATIVTGRNKIAYLAGSDSTDFEIKAISEDSGAVADTLEAVGSIHFLDDRGVRNMESVQAYGDWNIGTITESIEPLFKSRIGQEVAGVIRARAKNQYRIYWADGLGVSIYFGRTKPESMPIRIQFTPTCMNSTEDSSGDEMLMAGDDAGMVYQLDSGTSQDGAAVVAFIRFPFHHQGLPYREKQYHRGFLDVSEGGGGTAISYTTTVSFGDTNAPAAPELTMSLFGGGGFWDTAFWDLAYWDSVVQDQAIMEINQIGVNLGVVIFSDATYETPHTLASMAINYSPRRKLR